MAEPVVCTTVAGLREAIAERVAGGAESLGLLPTMGALHRGHLEIARRTRAENDLAVVSVLSTLFPLVTGTLGLVVLKERLTALQAAGVGAALAGVVLIAL